MARREPRVRSNRVIERFTHHRSSERYPAGEPWSIVPRSPTAHTLVEEVPQTPRRACVVPLERLDHLPLKWRIVPASPTAQISDADVPQTPRRYSVVIDPLDQFAPV